MKYLASRTIEDAISESKPNLLHDHGIWLSANHAVAKAAQKFQIARVISPRGMLEPWALSHRRFKKNVAWWLYQRNDLATAHGLHATASTEAEQFRRLGLKNPILVSPNGVKPPDLLPVISKRVTTNRTMLFLGRLHQKKGLAMLIEAWKRVLPQGWKMLVVGPDENGHRAELEALVLKAGLQESWDFRDEVVDADKWQLLVDADLFVLPTHSENFGISVAEALAAGTPVITTKAAPWEGLLHHGCGWWVEPNIDAIATALTESCKQSPEQLTMAGQQGQFWVAGVFSWPGIAKQMLSFYDWILKGGPPPANVWVD